MQLYPYIFSSSIHLYKNISIHTAYIHSLLHSHIHSHSKMTSQQYGVLEIIYPVFLASTGLVASPLYIPWLLLLYWRPIPSFYKPTPSSGTPLAFHVYWGSPQRPNPVYPVFQSLIQYLGVPRAFEGAGASHNNSPRPPILHLASNAFAFPKWPHTLNFYPKSFLSSIFGYTSHHAIIYSNVVKNRNRHISTQFCIIFTLK